MLTIDTAIPYVMFKLSESLLKILMTKMSFLLV